MENLIISTSTITWERTKTKHGSIIKYKNQITKHEGHISVSTIMLINGKAKHSDLTHIPDDLISKIGLLTETD